MFNKNALLIGFLNNSCQSPSASHCKLSILPAAVTKLASLDNNISLPSVNVNTSANSNTTIRSGTVLAFAMSVILVVPVTSHEFLRVPMLSVPVLATSTSPTGVYWYSSINVGGMFP